METASPDNGTTTLLQPGAAQRSADADAYATTSAPVTKTNSPPLPQTEPDSDIANRVTTIYSCDEAERATLEVPLQVSFTGPSYILDTDTADILCSGLGVSGLLRRMNKTLQTDYDLSPSREQLLRHCLDSFTDFGQAYALLRPRWHLEPSEALQEVEICRSADEKLRQDAMKNDIIVNSEIQPRRIWDLWSNRVVPIWMTTPYQGERWKTFFAVSHSWMEDNLRASVLTPINGHEWPVPIPIDSTLARVRVELLNYAFKLDVNLVWLDVLCLRQEGVLEKEEMRLDEWKLDVPTIGALYPDALRTVYYYSGLGRPFEVGDPASPRHWQNRAWTLQETNPNRIIGGVSSHSPSMPGIDTRDAPIDDAIRPFYNKIDVWESFSHVVDSVYVVLDAMRHRSATSELDKIAGLNYYLAKFGSLPAYIRSDDPESAWIRLIRETDSTQRGDLFFLFPEPGDGKHVWCPSWQQIKDAKMLPQHRTVRQGVSLNEGDGLYNVTGSCVQECYVSGLSSAGIGDAPRTGKVQISGKDGAEHTIPVLASHQRELADGVYMLIGGPMAYSTHWVIAQRRGDSVEKISIIEVVGDRYLVEMNNLSEEKVLNQLV